MTTAVWVLLSLLTASLVIVALVALRTARQLRRVMRHVETLSAEVLELRDRSEAFAPLLADTRSALRKSQNERLRADDLILTATSLTGRADAATKLVVSVVTNPIVRMLSTFSGIRRGLQRLLRRQENPPVKIELPPTKPRRELTSKGGHRRR